MPGRELGTFLALSLSLSLSLSLKLFILAGVQAVLAAFRRNCFLFSQNMWRIWLFQSQKRDVLCVMTKRIGFVGDPS
jgi:hypothetical protein